MCTPLAIPGFNRFLLGLFATGATALIAAAFWLLGELL
jgi:hypothetical protein